MKVVLVRPAYETHIITPPLGIGYLASYLKSQGHSVVLIDGLRDPLPTDELLRRVLAEKPNLVGITCLTAFYDKVVSLSRQLKQSRIPVVVGGVHPTFLPGQTLEDTGADFCVCGEGEIALAELLRGNMDGTGIKGMYSGTHRPLNDEEAERAEIVEDLDNLPYPDWSQMDPRTYPIAPHGAITLNYPIGIITSTRGCPYDCTFCASPGFYCRRVRYRSPDNVVSEIKYLVDHFGVREIHFEDDNLTLKRAHVEGICDLLLEQGIQVRWACPNGIRADKVDRELIRLMKKSGCYYFAYGIESANPGILSNIKKKETIDTIEEAIRIADEEGIQCQGFFIFGLPGETEDTIEESIQFACRSRLARAQFLILDVLPGSQLWQVLRGHFDPNWMKNSYKEPEWIPPGLTRAILMKAQSRAFHRFYFRPQIFFRMARSIRFRQLGFLWHRLREYRLLHHGGGGIGPPAGTRDTIQVMNETKTPSSKGF